MKPLNQTMNAKDWADEFIYLFGDKKEKIDHELMLGWFANAIMVGYDHAKNEAIDFYYEKWAKKEANNDRQG